MHKIYLAGFDVFRPDAIEHGEKLKKLCTAAGVIGLYPLDNDIPQGLAMEDSAQWICKSNMAMLTQADAVLANLESFRGHEPDSGTVFEVGVAIALGKPVWAYFPKVCRFASKFQRISSAAAQTGISLKISTFRKT